MSKKRLFALVGLFFLAVMLLGAVETAAAPDPSRPGADVILLEHGQSLIVRCRLEIEHPRPVQNTPETVVIGCAPVGQ